MTNNDFIKNPDLPGDDFFWKGNQTGVLLIHGFTATTAEVRLMAEKLHQDGLTTAGPLLPGHGTTPDDLNHTTWKMWLEKVKEFYEKLSRHCDQTFLIAESMGTLLALELAVQHPEIKGLLLFAPAIEVNGLWVSKYLAPFINFWKKAEKDDNLPWKGYTITPVKAAAELLKLQKHTRKQLPKVSQPTIVFTGEHDQTISPRSAGIILNNINSANKQQIHMAKSAHCILLDCERDKAYQYSTDFIQTMIK